MLGDKSMNKTANRLFIASLIFMILGLVCVAIGVAFPVWNSVGGQYYGVFQNCDEAAGGTCISTRDEAYSNINYKDAKLYPLLWGLVVVGLFLLFLSTLFHCTYPIYRKINHCKVFLGIILMTFSLLAIISFLTALIIWVDAARENNGLSLQDAFENIGWAWYLTLAGLVSLFTSWILFFLHIFFLVCY